MLLPFLYPVLFRTIPSRASHTPSHVIRSYRSTRYVNPIACQHRAYTDLAEVNAARRAAAYELDPQLSKRPESKNLNPTPDDYSRSLFADKCTLLVQAGAGGNGCAAFLREAHLPDGPPNGGDGGNGGSVFIQAVRGHTSLHKLARQGRVKAGKGQGGQGKSQSGRRGDDVCIEVPVGTVIREISRLDPPAIADAEEPSEQADLEDAINAGPIDRNHYVLYPTTRKKAQSVSSPAPSRHRDARHNPLLALQPESPINLDLSYPQDKPLLLLAGGVGGLGNPHFVTKEEPKPKIASKGTQGVKIKIELELKLLADVGLVGLPNAGKSTLVRALSNSRTRIGDWAFTTLSPSIGTVVLDHHEGRVSEAARRRAQFTIADIPGLIEDAHLDKGLGIKFLRHVERAGVLAFVVDLSSGDAVKGLKALWREVGEYEELRVREVAEETQRRLLFGLGSAVTTGNAEDGTEQKLYNWTPGFRGPDAGQVTYAETGEDAGERIIVHPRPPPMSSAVLSPISSKPWFVIATKADLPETQEAYAALAEYVTRVEEGSESHPIDVGNDKQGLAMQKKNVWKGRLGCIPVSAITESAAAGGKGGGGVERVKEWVAGLMDAMSI